MDNTQNIISLCTGYGGIELGLRRTGMDARTCCYVEIEAFAQANLVAKIEEGRMDSAPIFSDLKTFPAQEFRGKVHGIIGGYPCQPFSAAGQRKGTEDPRHLWPYILEHIRTIRPVWCFFENVEGHISLGLREVIEDLEGEGYETTWGIFSAEEVGAPHRRKRIFILAYSTNHNWSRSAKGRINDTEAGSASEELGNTKHDGSPTGEKSGSPKKTIRDNTERKNSSSQPEGAGESKELADSEHIRLKRCEHSARHWKELSQDRMPSELVHSSSEGSQGHWQSGEKQIQEGWQRKGRHTTTTSLYPARPGEQQHDWEEPRTIEPSMGRTANGVASRVDELRLLGNGVVPATAELAFKTLWRKINE